MRLRVVLPLQWYRVDKGNGDLLAVNAATVATAASGAYSHPGDVVRLGRFATTFAIYSQGEQLTDNERTVA